MGRILFWLSWPLIWLYSPLFRRCRVVVHSGDSIVIVKNKFGAGYWQLPGGGIKLAESLRAAACRELKEELGVEALEQNIETLHDGVRIVKQFGLLMRYQFTSLGLKNQEELMLSSEHTDVRWVTLTDLHNYRLAREVIVGEKLI